MPRPTLAFVDATAVYSALQGQSEPVSCKDLAALLDWSEQVTKLALVILKMTGYVSVIEPTDGHSPRLYSAIPLRGIE